MKVKEVAELAGVSVRTLHHYDEIGLLVPDQLTEAGYRDYSQQNLELLQQICFYRELGFPLKQIKAIVTDESFDRLEALSRHKQMLREKRDQLDRLLRTIEKTMKYERGEMNMTNKEKFEGFDFSVGNPYEGEARERWGDRAVDDSNAKLDARKQDGSIEQFQEEMNELYRRLAALRRDDPKAPASQTAIKEWFDLLNRMGTYSLEAFKGLGQMYVDDERFTKNIDKFGDGLALFMRDAMAFYADSRS